MRTEVLTNNNGGALVTPEDRSCSEITISINIENIYIDQGSHFKVMPPAEELPDPDLFQVDAGF